MKNNDAAFHSACFACGTGNEHGLQLKFKDGPTESTCNISIPTRFQSYDGIVHGGIIATLLDAAMVHSLHRTDGKSPVTCRLEVRYLHAIPPDKRIMVISRKAGKRGKIMLANAEILCSGICFARAKGAFTSQ